MRYLILLLTFCVFNSNASVNSQKGKLTPERVEGITTVTAKKLATLMLDLKQLVVIDARVKKGRKKGYIENSHHLPDIETSCLSLKKIVPSLNNPVVFYCSSNKCGRSLNAVQIAKTCGYRQLYWFRGGFREWKSVGYTYKK